MLNRCIYKIVLPPLNVINFFFGTEFTKMILLLLINLSRGDKIERDSRKDKERKQKQLLAKEIIY